MERSYTVKEIDDLRKACENKLLCGRFSGPLPEKLRPAGKINGIQMYWRTPRPVPKTGEVEELLRTYMLAGHTAQALCDADHTPEEE